MTKLAFLLLAAACLSSQQRPNGLYAIFNTSMGAITARLLEKDTPATVENFVALAQGDKATRSPRNGAMVKVPLYNNITFHRVVPGEMIQAGDPTGTGSHNCGFTIRDEILPGLRFDRSGRLATANTGNPDSGGCQFFITSNVESQWNGKYTIFGQVVEGLSVVDKIASVRVREEKPITPVRLISVTIERVKSVKR